MDDHEEAPEDDVVPLNILKRKKIIKKKFYRVKRQFGVDGIEDEDEEEEEEEEDDELSDPAEDPEVQKLLNGI